MMDLMIRVDSMGYRKFLNRLYEGSSIDWGTTSSVEDSEYLLQRYEIDGICSMQFFSIKMKTEEDLLLFNLRFT